MVTVKIPGTDARFAKFKTEVSNSYEVRAFTFFNIVEVVRPTPEASETVSVTTLSLLLATTEGRSNVADCIPGISAPFLAHLMASGGIPPVMLVASEVATPVITLAVRENG